MEYSFFDIHSHVHFPEYKDDWADVLERLRSAGGATIAIGTDKETSERVVDLALRNENVFACVGVYPVSIDQKEDEVLYIEKLLADDSSGGDADVPGKIVAVGECGLDYASDPSESEKSEQKRLFQVQIDLAVKYGKPVMIHCREAYDDVLEILEINREKYGNKFHPHMHFFVGDEKVLKRVLDCGGTVSFTGVVTFARQYDEVIKMVPKDRIMAETDAPYVTPVPHRGKRNEPLYVKEVIAKLAEIRGEPVEEFSKNIRENVRRVFGV